MSSELKLYNVGSYYGEVALTSFFKVAADVLQTTDDYALQPTTQLLSNNPTARTIAQGIYTIAAPVSDIMQDTLSLITPNWALSQQVKQQNQQEKNKKSTKSKTTKVIRNNNKIPVSEHHTHSPDSKIDDDDDSMPSNEGDSNINFSGQLQLGYDVTFNPQHFYTHTISPQISYAREFLEDNTPQPLDTLNSLDAAVIATLTFCAAVVLLTTILRFLKRAIFGSTVPHIPIQILDVAVFDDFKPYWRVSNEEWFKRGAAWFHFHDDEIRFMRMIGERSGIGYATHFSPGIVEFPPNLCIQSAREEAELVMFGCIDKLLLENNISPKDIDVVVTNCSLFNPTPSISAMIVNHYKMRSDVQTFHLGGMGCSASPLAVNLASSCLRLHPKKHPLAIVVSMENITQNIYFGRERAFMLQNALFRLGGAAILLTRDTKPVLGRPQPRWTIQHSSHIHTASNTDAYTVVFQDIDKEDRVGVRLDKGLMSVAATAISKNLQTLGPKILPISAMLDYAYRVAYQFIMESVVNPMILKKKSNGKPELIVPNFRSAIDHFAVHAGGRGVLDAIQASLKLNDSDLLPSRNTLYFNGNTSSSSIWYEYKQVEALRHPRKGETMLQIAVGSGFKVNLLYLKALCDINPKKSISTSAKSR